MKTMKTLGAGAMLGLASLAAWATPAPQVYAAYGYNNPYVASGSNVTVFNAGSLTQVDANASFSAMASLGGPVAQAFVGTSGYLQTGLPNTGVSASAAVQYDFLVSNGGVFSDIVPITITGFAFVDSAGHGQASAYAKVAHSSTAGGTSTGSLTARQLEWSCGNGGADCGVVIPFTLTVQINAFGLAEPGEIGRVSLAATAQIIEASPFSTGVSAYVDPLIVIDASYLATHPNAQLLMNAAITNAATPPAVPEPGPAALLLAGLTGLWLRGHRVRT